MNAVLLILAVVKGFALIPQQTNSLLPGKGYRGDLFNRAISELAQFEMHTTALNGETNHF
jgi:hypothetical protein